MGIKFKNDAVSVLTGGLTTVSTDILINAADDGKFPVIASIGADYFYLTLEDKDHNIEIVKIVRHVSGSNNLETDGTVDSGVNRGLDGTTARTWSIGDVVEIRSNAKALEEAIAEGQQPATDHINDPSDAHDASAISYSGGVAMSATDLEGAVDELEGDTIILASESKKIGKETIWIPAAAMQPTVSNGCATFQRVQTVAGQPDLNVLDFDAAADEFAQFQVAMPKSWNGGTLTYQVFWSGTPISGNVTWMLQGGSVADDEPLAVAYGTAVSITDAAGSAANDVMVSAESGALTVAGTPANGELCVFRFGRDADNASDTYAGDARLLGIKLFFTTNAINDA